MDDSEHLLEKLDGIAAGLSEHFESVLILCSGAIQDGSGATGLFSSQKGNIHAHQGCVWEWQKEQDAYMHGYHAEKGRLDARRDAE